MEPSRDISRLIAIMAALRTPVTGCPWDLDQTFSTIAPFTIEEAYEVADAIERGDMVDLVDELGDLLLQVVYHARIAEEAGHFAFPDVVEAITAKLIRRHPHVFGERRADNPGTVKALWDAIKAEEKTEKRARRGGADKPGEVPSGSALAGVPAGLSPLERAVRLQDRAGAVGFDWNDPRAVLSKLREEIDEIEAALADDAPQATVEEEIGDLLFVVANLARHLKVSPESAVKKANSKFTRRFLGVEALLAADGRSPREATLAEMEAHWGTVKRAERSGGA